MVSICISNERAGSPYVQCAVNAVNAVNAGMKAIR